MQIHTETDIDHEQDDRKHNERLRKRTQSAK